MGHRAAKRGEKTRSFAPTAQQLRPQLNVEQRLAEILTDLARVLVSSGYGIGGLSRLAKQAFVDAAQALAQSDGHRQSNARIAALTGLTRAEVSLLARSQTRIEGHSRLPINRAQRVSLGWVSNDSYCDRFGRPKILPFTGSRTSFEKLVKCYSGDIPARAMLSEMTRLGMVRETPDKSLKLVRIDSPISRHTTTSLNAISPWTRFLAEGSCDEARELHANTARVTLSFESLPQLFSAVRELQGRTEAFVTSVHELGAHGKAAQPHKLQVSIALATRVPRSDRSSNRKKLRSS